MLPELRAFDKVNVVEHVHVEFDSFDINLHDSSMVHWPLHVGVWTNAARRYW